MLQNAARGKLSNPQGEKQVCGVGIAFAEAPGAPITVKCLSKGGSAEQHGKIEVGDVVDAVEDASVEGKSVAELKKMMMGEIGTYVNLQLRRGPMQYEVSLMRGQAEAFLIREKQRLQALIENDHKQLNHAQVS